MVEHSIIKMSHILYSVKLTLAIYILVMLCLVFGLTVYNSVVS